MAKYLRVVKGILAQFNDWYAEHVSREDNTTADAYPSSPHLKSRTTQEVSTFSTPIPFAIWGMDILGIFLVASGQRKFIVVAIDYFTKWIEAKTLAQITTKKIAQFFWENVICRYGIPCFLATDNGRQFDYAEFGEYFDDNNIELHFTSVSHPQANGLVEIANRIILDGIKKMVERSRNTWADELLYIVPPAK
ncbi:uncharacterized protein LOC141696039 [Apium graveolens]|uniref:uncharacterized protein LOC141696039 n=1 Tax=Apium graveolens TaxID=4045 RepID=UPI003D79E946